MEPFPLTGGYGAVAFLRARARELGEAAVPGLEVVVRDGCLELRAAALLALAEIAPAATEALVLDRAQHDPEREVREAATRALGYASGAASLSFLRGESDEDRAARIALKARCQGWSNLALEEVVVAAIDGGSADDRFASVCLDVLAERRTGSAEVVLDVMRRRPGFISAGAAEGLGAGVGPERQDELLDLIAEYTDTEEAPVFGSMARYAEPARVFERLAPVVRSGPPALAKAIVASLSEQASAAWTAADGPGFDDGASPVGPMPDERWYEVLTRYVPFDDSEPHDDFDLGLEALKDSLVWTYRERERATRGFRYLDSGAEEGAAFVVAGFDLGSQRDTDAIELQLADLGPRSVTNLHHVSHQCGGHGCAHYDLLGIPLGSRRMSEELSPDSPLVGELMNHLDTWKAADATALAAVREILLRFVPRLPTLTGGLEALVWTAPASLVEALEGVPVVRILPTCHPWRAISGFFDHPPDTLAELGPFTDAHQRLLEEVGRRLGLGAPQLFVVWANSD